MVELERLAADIDPTVLKAINSVFPILRVQKNGLVERGMCLVLKEIYENGGITSTPTDREIAEKILEKYGGKNG